MPKPAFNNTANPATQDHSLGVITPESSDSLTLVDQRYYHADFGSGIEGFIWDDTLDKSTVDFLRTIDPSQLYDFAAQGTGAGTGAFHRQFDDYSVIKAGQYGYKTDSDGRTPGNGQDNYPIIQGIIDALPVAPNILHEDGFDDTSNIRVGGYVIELPRTESGLWARFSQKFVIPNDKNIVFRSTRASHGAWIDDPTEDLLVDFDQGGQGAEIGVQGLTLRYGGIRFQGSMNGHGIVAENLLFIEARGTCLETIDKYEVDNPNPTPPASFPGASRNVTQFYWRNISTVSCNRALHLRATTYSKGSIENVRCVMSEQTPILIQTPGVDLRTLEFLGVSEIDRDNKAFIQLLPDDYHACDNVSITGHVRFGSEDNFRVIDAAGTRKYFSPPRQAIILGEPNVATDQTVARCKFGDSNNNWNAPGFNGNNNSPFEMNSVFHITARPTGCTIDGIQVGDISGPIIDETHYVGEIIQTINQIRNVSRLSRLEAPLFSHNGHGWDTRGAELIGSVHHNHGVDLKTDALTFGANATQEAVATGPNGELVWTITSTDANTFATSDGTQVSGRLIFRVLARSAPVNPSTKMAVRIRAIGAGETGGSSQYVPINDEWRWYEYYPGQLSATNTAHTVRVYPGEPEGVNTAAQIEVAEIEILQE